MALSQSWSDALDTGGDSIVIALDIAGAFVKVWHSSPHLKPATIGISGYLHALPQDDLHSRTLSIDCCYNGASIKFPKHESATRISIRTHSPVCVHQ